MSPSNSSLNLNLDLHHISSNFLIKRCFHMSSSIFILNIEFLIKSRASLKQRNNKINNLSSFLCQQSLFVTHGPFVFVFKCVVKLSQANFNKFSSLHKQIYTYSKKIYSPKNRLRSWSIAISARCVKSWLFNFNLANKSKNYKAILLDNFLWEATFVINYKSNILIW